MTLIQAIVLGFVQGMTEFLPVSSSGHLVIFEHLFQVKNVILYDTILHLATLLAVIIFFFKDLLALKLKEWMMVAVGTIPAVVIGLLLKDIIESAFSSLLFVTCSLFFTGLLLIITHRVQPNQDQQKNQKKWITYKQAILIGLAQSVAIFPGVSRSGSTTTIGILSGVSRENSFKFSFFLAIPAIFGAGILQLKDVVEMNGLTSLPWKIYFPGAIVAFIFGLSSLRWFRYVIKKAKLQYFGYYCWTISGILALWQIYSQLLI